MFTCTCTLGVLFIEHKRHFLIKYRAGVSMIHFFKLMHQHLEHSGALFAFQFEFPCTVHFRKSIKSRIHSHNLLNSNFTSKYKL